MTARDGQIAGGGGPACQHDGMELTEKVTCTDISADFHIAFEYDAGFFHQFYPPGHYPFFQLEIGNPIPEQPTGFIIPFEDGDGVTRSIELIGSGKTGRPRADNGYFFACPQWRMIGFDEAFIERDLDNMSFYFFDSYRRLVDAQHATAFARCGADTPGEFGEIVGRTKYLICLMPLLAVYVIVEFRNDVAQWTAVMAERDTTVHASG
jgi:hypothetical protein